jgi:hypothetical protein
MSAYGLNGDYVSRLDHPRHKAFDLLLKIVSRNQIFGLLPDRFWCRIPKDLRESWVDARNPGVAVDHDNSVWNPREQFAELCPPLLEFVAQADKRLQVPLQDIAAM